mmetsp:Transcript_43187/g.104559  ORF Transcript_43187/g.104559 Transcript_43187/m.104559 type:complete len:569 (+) Transcript_43187:132-1838(+)
MAMMVVVPSSAVKTMIISTKMIVVVMTTMMMMMITTMASYPVLAAATPMGERAAAATAATAAASTDRTSSSSSVTTSGGATATVVVVERETVKIDYSELQEVFGHGNDNDDGDKDDGDGDGDARRTLLLSLQKRIFDAFGSSRSSSSTATTITAMSDSEPPSKETTVRPNQQVMEPLGLLEVTNVPTRIQQLRQQVLGRHAVDLAHLPPEELSKLEFPETMYTIGWSHGKEKLKKKKEKNKNKKKPSSSSPMSRTSSDGREEEEEGRDQEQKHIVDGDRMSYDTTKGSFYFDPYDVDDESTRTTKTIFPEVLQPQFEHDLIEVTRFMTQVGLWIAKLCDMTLLVVQQHGKESIDKNESPSMIYDSLQSGRAAKARLLYYYPMKNSSSSISRRTTSNGDGGYDSTGAVATTRNEGVDDDDDDEEEEEFDTWCGWHKDHSSLTVLLPGLMHEYEKEDDNDGDNSNIDNVHQSILQPNQELQHNKKHKSGLYIQIRDRQQQKYSGDKIGSSDHGPPTELVHVALQETSLGFQIGETIEIMSRGTLHATPHAVKAPAPPLSSDTKRSTGRAS